VGVAEKLREFKVNKSAVARAFSVSRNAVHRFTLRHPELIEVVNECRETFVDNVESAIYTGALAGSVPSQIFIL
jgi:hypothetical protein